MANITINAGSAQNSNGTNGSFSAFNVALGDLIVVGWANDGGTGQAPTDNAGNTYIALAGQNNGFQSWQMWYCFSIAAKTGLVITFPAAGSWGCISYNAANGTWAFDQSKVANGQGVTTLALASITTPGEGVISCFTAGYHQAQVETFSASSPCTSESNLVGSATNGAVMVFDSISQSGAQTTTCTATCSVSEYFVIYGASFYVQAPVTVYNLVAAGTVLRAYNGVLSPVVPALARTGNLLILMSEMVLGSLQASGLSGAADPRTQGWTLLGPPSGSGVNCLGVWTKIATGAGGSSSPDAVNINWGTINTDSFAGITAYSGNYPSVTGLVHALSYYGNNANGAIVFNPLVITLPNCLVLLCATKNNVNNGSTFLGVQNNGAWVIDQTVIGNYLSSDVSAVLNRQFQTTATSISNATQNMSAADGSNQAYATVGLALLPTPTPPPSTSYPLESNEYF